jgi:RNA polymerase primary sigma factor/RNA polymerase sigma factor
MSTYKIRDIEALKHQLLYLPPKTQLRVADRLEDLLRDFSLTADYSYEFLYFKLTGFKPETDVPGTWRGRELRRELLNLLSDLSEANPCPVRESREYVYSIDELERLYNISVRTIFRWRRKGLVSRKYVFPDGRTRTGVRKSSLEHYIDENTAKVTRSSRFSRVSPAEREQIIELARLYVQSHGLNLTTAADRISRELGRSRETIRYILRRHDAANEDDRIFPEKPSLEPAGVHQAVFEAWKQDESVAKIARRFKISRSSVYRIVNRLRAVELLNEDFSYIPSPEFDERGAEKRILHSPEPELPPEHLERKRPSNPDALPPYLRSLYDTPLLTRELEQHLFRQFNYLKYKISKLRTDLDVNAYVPSGLLDEIETLAGQVTAIKNRILKSNLRLVVSVAKRHTSASVNLFDLISEGNFCLMYAIDKFDYTRGNRFSTYATWALMKNFARTVPEASQLQRTFVTGQQEILNAVPAGTPEPEALEFQASLRDRILETLSQLTSREQQVLKARFGLNNGGQKLTLAEVGDTLGVTRERIRQIETKALQKMRSLLEESRAELLS